MPLRLTDPFRDPTASLVRGHNHYVDLMIEAQSSGSLPLLYGQELRNAVGCWREKFTRFGAARPPRELFLEIGCHRGDVIADMAYRHPDAGFIGMDITFKRVVGTAQKAKNRELANVVSVLADAAHIDALFHPEEIDGVVVFFPDPWTAKSRQAKKRLFTPGFCQKLHQVVRPGGFIWLKTDSRLYFDNATEFMLNSSFTPLPTPAGIPAERYTSGFERIFEQKDAPVHRAVWVKKPHQIISFYN